MTEAPLKATPSNAVTVGISISAYESGGMQTLRQTMAESMPALSLVRVIQK